MNKRNRKRKTNGSATAYADKARIPDELWERIEPLMPPWKRHPLGCHNPRVPDRKPLDAILFVLRIGCQWNDLNATGICSGSSARGAAGLDQASVSGRMTLSHHSVVGPQRVAQRFNRMPTDIG